LLPQRRSTAPPDGDVLRALTITLGNNGRMAEKGGYGKGYTTFGYHVSGGHEAEAKEAEEAKRPNRLGMWFLRKLGYKGADPEPPTIPHHGAPGHPKSHPTK
jgi:hypothetical protein